MQRGIHNRDVRLARRFAAGDRDAIAPLVDDYYASVVNFVCRFTGQRDDAHDIAQDIFLKILRAIGSYDGKASLRTWIFTIAANASRDSVRRRKRRRESIAPDPELVLVREEADSDVEGQPEARLGRSVRARTVRDAVEKLPEVHRLTVVLRFFHDLSLQEIAEICGCTIGTVGSRLHYAIKKLRKILDGDDTAREVLDAAEGGLGL